MIFLMSQKIWDKNKKKLVEPKDYIILDATDDGNARLDAFTNTVTFDNLAIPAKLLHMFDDEDFEDIMDLDNIKELEEQFFRGLKFQTSALASISAFLDQDINVFIVIRNKAYDFWREKYRKEYIKLFPDSANFFVVLPKKISKYKKELSHNFSESEISYMKKELSKKEKQMEERAKQAKHSDKKNKKKNKKHKKDGLGFDEWA